VNEPYFDDFPIHHSDDENQIVYDDPGPESDMLQCVDILNYQSFNGSNDSKQLFLVQEEATRMSNAKYVAVYLENVQFETRRRLMTSCSQCPQCNRYQMIKTVRPTQPDIGLHREFFNGCDHIRSVILAFYMSIVESDAISLRIVDIENTILNHMHSAIEIVIGIIH
jgi:hypothetical protein